MIRWAVQCLLSNQDIASSERQDNVSEGHGRGGVVVYRTKYRHELDMVVDELEAAGVAVRRSIESPGGFHSAVSLGGPVGLLPLADFLVVVSDDDVDRAKALIALLPISHET